MRGWVTIYCLRVYYVIVTLFFLRSTLVTSLRTENRCMRHYFVQTIRHPNKLCESKNVLLSRCEGYCSKSRSKPRVTFNPVLYRPFKQYCTCCTPVLSILKAVPLLCQGVTGSSPATDTLSAVGVTTATLDSVPLPDSKLNNNNNSSGCV